MRKSRDLFFIFEGLSGRVIEKKGQEEENEFRGVKSVFPAQRSDSRLQANNPYSLQAAAFSLPYPKTCFHKRPRQFTVTYPSSFFSFSTGCISFLNQICTFTNPPFSVLCYPLSSSVSFKDSLMFSSATVTPFYLDISKLRRSLTVSPENVSIVPNLLYFHVFECAESLFRHVCRPSLFIKYSHGLRRSSGSHHSYCLHALCQL